jgi:PKD repeat protein
MDTITAEQNRIGDGLKYYFTAFCALSLCLLVTANVYAAVNQYDIQVDYSFDTGAVSGKEVSGYRLYKEADQVCDAELTELQSFTCKVTGESGDYNFFLSALYRDGTESPKSSAFTFTIPEITSVPVAPSISLNSIVITLSESTDTDAMVKVAEIVVSDPDGGTNNLGLSGPDAVLFTIIGSELFLKSGIQLDFETNSILEVTVEVDDPGFSPIPDDSSSLTISVTDANEAATVSIENLISTISEAVDTNSDVKVADIVITDDNLGTNYLVLSGPDASMFTIAGSDLAIKSGVALDFESRNSLSVTVEVNDPGLSQAPEDSSMVVINILDSNESPSVALNNKVTSLSENTNTSTAIRVADVTVTDDSLGTNNVSLSGSDAGMFSLIGSGLFLKSGIALDFESRPSLAVTVRVDDPALPAAPEAIAPITISITDINEPPSISLKNVISSLEEGVDTSATVKIADISVMDDGLGNNILGLSGTEAGLFTISGTGLYLKAGTELDYETDRNLDIVVEVNDQQLSDTPIDNVVLTITITDSNDAPTVRLANQVTTLAENVDTVTAVKVADIVIEDDALGTNNLSVSGPDALLFVVTGQELHLKAGSVLDFEANSVLDITVAADDPGLPGAVESNAVMSIAIIDIDESLPPEPEPTQPPEAVITLLNAAGEAPLLVGFDSVGSTVDELLSATYTWKFGDGSSASGKTASHTFTTSSNYMAKLTVTDSSGQTDTATSPVAVSVPQMENEPPVSTFVATSNPDFPLTIAFDGAQSSDPDGSIVRYSWDFGDGSGADGMALEYLYSGIGEYVVTLQVTDNEGQMSESSQLVTAANTDVEPLVFELAEVQVDNEWTSFTFSKPFVDPVIIAGPLSSEDAEPATVRISNVSKSGFDIRIQEWDYLDDSHRPEILSFIVFEKGIYTLKSGAKVEVGSFNTRSTRFKTFSLQQSYGVAPVILTQVMTDNETDAVTVRLRRIDQDSFEYKLQEQELNKKVHATESIGYVALEPGKGAMYGLVYEVGNTPQVVTDKRYDLEYQSTLSSLPFFFARMQTTAGGNTSVVRSQSLNQSTAVIKIEEEQSKDDEVRHTAKEAVGYIILGPAVN